jgi:hypothetical protein
VENWPEFNPEALLRRLVAHGVDFVIVGGMAMVLHGSARLTRDLDICYSIDPANLEALGAAVVELGAHLSGGVSEDLPLVPDARTLRQTTLLTLDSDDGRIDLLASPAGAPPYPQLRERATRTTFDGTAILIASLDDMESMKRAAGRPRDLVDVEEIEVIRRLRRQLGTR